MKKDLIKYLVLTFVLTMMIVPKTFASVNSSSVYQQQLEQMRQQNEALNQQNEYLRQQTEILKQQTDSLRQNQAYTQGYIEGQKYDPRYDQRNYHYQLYTGMGVGYVMGQLFAPRHCYYWHRGCRW